ncbi:MAG: hypothetical protein F6J94_28560 [Moorea sp. SIO1F2]|uniref:hypothetical protein n=1 Tax=unclassified Moorena TaxID=2683338 RepID=UPI0013B8B0B9|nr:MULTISPECIES: hypothetical protein [unclassified Moorena]NEO66778.1 hypothetical protein [Moorena sp. SIO4G2]NEQ61200.1 hypothetical protein [Moorena sp. SIO4A1]NET85705.1 hypothetical protein [Moorena sp. SIO1F2]
MAAIAKKVNKTVAFTSNREDQSLLKAVEKELAKGQYPSFSMLCKQALQEFLLRPESSEEKASSQEATEETTEETTGVGNLEDKLTQLQQQLTEVVQALSVQSPSQLNSQLSDMTQRIEEIDSNTTQQLTQLQQQLGKLEQVLSTEESSDQLDDQLTALIEQVKQVDDRSHQQLEHLKQQVAGVETVLSNFSTTDLSGVREQASTEKATRESDGSLRAGLEKEADQSDPLLSRLGSLLEDF